MGTTFLAQFATKEGMNTQLLTSTLGPVELWAFTTTAEDVNIRNKLYKKIGPSAARRVLATLFPAGTATKYLNDKLTSLKQQTGFIDEDMRLSTIDQLLKDIMDRYTENPEFRHLA